MQHNHTEEKAEMIKHEFFIEKESGSSTIMGTKAKYIERLKTFDIKRKGCKT